jgi:hypothetical protein
VKGQIGNTKAGPKDLARFGDILMREFYKTVPVNLAGKTVNETQGEIVALEIVKSAILKGPAAMSMLSGKTGRSRAAGNTPARRGQ